MAGSVEVGVVAEVVVTTATEVGAITGTRMAWTTRTEATILTSQMTIDATMNSRQTTVDRGRLSPRLSGPLALKNSRYPVTLRKQVQFVIIKFSEGKKIERVLETEQKEFTEL